MKLKPCPFCGNEKLAEREGELMRSSLFQRTNFYQIDCINCFASIESLVSREFVIEAWNRRAK